MPEIRRGPKGEGDPTIRLAVTTAMTSSGDSGEKRYPFHKDNPASNLTTLTESPTIRLAHVPGAQGDNNLLGRNGVEALPDTSLPGLLVSYYYLEAFEKNREKFRFRDWVMDSGAFSAWQSGVEIDLQKYIDCCKRIRDSDSSLVEVFALDVIGDWKLGLKNVEEMWKQGVEAIPTFHFGEPWDVLKGLAKDYPKIALGGAAGKERRLSRDGFAGQCFARVWPKRIHGFGFGTDDLVMKYPWHSVDATTWEISPCGFGRWNSFGHIGKKGKWVGGKMSVRGSSQNLRAEIEWYLDLERRARIRWKNEMAKLNDLEAPTVRLAECGTGVREGRLAKEGEGVVVEGYRENSPMGRLAKKKSPDTPTVRQSIKDSQKGK